jgi:hypothetical protein
LVKKKWQTNTRYEDGVIKGEEGASKTYDLHCHSQATENLSNTPQLLPGGSGAALSPPADLILVLYLARSGFSRPGLAGRLSFPLQAQG